MKVKLDYKHCSFDRTTHQLNTAVGKKVLHDTVAKIACGQARIVEGTWFVWEGSSGVVGGGVGDLLCNEKLR